MAKLDHVSLVKEFQDQFQKARNTLKDITIHLSKSKSQKIHDIINQITELLHRINSAAKPRRLEVEVTRAIARDFETISNRWNELEQFVIEEIQFDDYLSPSAEERTQQETQILQTIHDQKQQALNAAGAMFGAAQEWKRAAQCFKSVAQNRRVEVPQITALPAMVREYRCYEELDHSERVLEQGYAMYQVLSTCASVSTDDERAMLRDFASLFRKTAMRAITNRHEEPKLNVPLGAIFLWCEAEALALAAEPDDETPYLRFRSLAEYFEQVAKEELEKPEPSIERFVASNIEGAIAYLRVIRDIRGLSAQDAKRNSLRLQQQVTNFLLLLLEEMGYRQIRIVEDPSRAMKGLLAVIKAITRGHRGSEVLLALANRIGDMLIQARQCENQAIIDLTTIFRWLCEGVGLGLRVFAMKLISDIYRIGLVGDVLELGSKEELRQTIFQLLDVNNDDEVFSFFVDTEIEFDDVTDLFMSLELYWIAGLCKLGQGQLRQNISSIEISLPTLSQNQMEGKSEKTDEIEGTETPFWGAAPSNDFSMAAELFHRAFRSRRLIKEEEDDLSKSWIPRRNPDDLRRRAAQSRWLAGLAYIDEGNVKQGGTEFILAKSAYELLGRYREAIICLQVWLDQLVVPIKPDEDKLTRPTQDRLMKIIEICDELVGLYPLHNSGEQAAISIMKTVQFLEDQVGIDNWTLQVFLRAIEYTRKAQNLAQTPETTSNVIELLRYLREELSDLLSSEFAIGIYPNFETETTIYFETETPVKIAVLNISDKLQEHLTIRPIGVLPHLTPNPSKPWLSARDPKQVSMKNFYIGTDDNAFEIENLTEMMIPADAFGPPRAPPISLTKTSQDRIAPSDESLESTVPIGSEQPWLGVMWTGDYNGTAIGSLTGATEELIEEDTPLLTIDDITKAAFFTVFTKAAREGNIIPGQVFPVTFGIYEPVSSEPLATQTIYFKIASRPKILKAETQWAKEITEKWEETFNIVFEDGAHLPRYVPRFAPEFETKDYVNPESLHPTIVTGLDAVELSQHLKKVPRKFILAYSGQRKKQPGQHFEVQSTITLKVPMTGVIGDYAFLQIRTPTRSLTQEELMIPRLRNGVNFQELFYGTVFIGDSKIDGEYFVYRLWYCFEPCEQSPAPGANYRRGWTNHRLDIFLDPKTWEPKLLVTDYYVQYDKNHGEWVEALFTFKGVSSTLFGIRRINADFHREAHLQEFQNELKAEIHRALQPLTIKAATPLKISGFKLSQRLGFTELIRLSWARDTRDGPVTYKPLRTHLFRDYWSQRYEHGLYREDWRGSAEENRYEMRTLDRTGGKSKYVSKLGQRLIPHEVSIIPREGDRCDLSIQPPANDQQRITIRNVINPRRIELWTRPHISFSRRFNFFAKHFGQPPKIHTASLYFYSTRRALNPYFKGTSKGKDHWVHFPESMYWNGKIWTPIPTKLQDEVPPENLSYTINSWLEADAYWVFRYVYYWPLEFTLPLPHEDWERADIWVNARTGNIEWITSDYHWRELWYENIAKISDINPIIDFLFNWNTPEPLTVKDGAPVHESIVPYFKESKQIGEFADQLPWMFTRYRHSCEHLHKLHATFWDHHKVKIVYSFIIIFIILALIILTPLRNLFLP